MCKAGIGRAGRSGRKPRTRCRHSRTRSVSTRGFSISLRKKCFCIASFIQRRDLVDETTSIRVLEIHDRREVPVEVVGNEGHLLIELIEGAA
jgi:hypothetical protein